MYKLPIITNSFQINSFYIFDLVIESLNTPLTINMIKEWHSSLMYRTKLYDLGLAGVFKIYPNRIVGANFDTADPLEVEFKINELITNYNQLRQPTLDDIAKFHLIFEQIHPFQDGNGRIGRFIFLKQLLENTLPLRYMNGESSKEYKKSLADSSKDNIEPLIKYLTKQSNFIENNKNMF